MRSSESLCLLNLEIRDVFWDHRKAVPLCDRVREWRLFSLIESHRAVDADETKNHERVLSNHRPRDENKNKVANFANVRSSDHSRKRKASGVVYLRVDRKRNLNDSNK